MSGRKNLILNFSSLTIAQIANNVVPIIAIPYIVRVVGPAKYGTVAFATAIVSYFTLLTNWGINLYAPREIALLRGNKKAVSELVSNILYLKLISIFFGFLLYILMILAVPKFKTDKVLYIVISGYILINGVDLYWFFQGIEKMINIAIANFISRSIAVMLIFFIIKKPEDYIKIPVAYIIAGLVSKSYMLWIMFKKENIYFTHLDTDKIKKIIIETTPLFISNLAINVYTGINTVLLGFLSNSVIVGYYSVSEKIVKALLGLQRQISTVLYPHISSKLMYSRENAIRSIRQGLIVVMLYAIPVTLYLFLFSKPIVLLFAGRRFVESIPVLKILSFLFVVVGLSNVFGIQTLLTFGKRKDFMKPIIYAGMINLGLNFLLIPFFKHVGAAFSFLISEIFVTLYMFLKVKKIGANVFVLPIIYKFATIAGIMIISFGFLDFLGMSYLLILGILLVIYVVLVFGLKIIDFKKRVIPV